MLYCRMYCRAVSSSVHETVALIQKHLRVYQCLSLLEVKSVYLHSSLLFAREQAHL